MSVAAEGRAGVLSRLHDIDATVKRGYVIWSMVAIVIAIPEIWAAVGDPPWPTISGTIGHLETLWAGVAVIAVALIAMAAALAIRFGGTAPAAIEQADGRVLRMTRGGRLTGQTEYRELPVYWYVLPSIAGVLVGSVLAATMSDDEWVLAYVMYGLIGVLCVVVPSLLAYLPTPDAPFAGLFRTVGDLQHRFHFVGLIVIAGLVVLLIHLALYPWPDIFRENPTPGSL